MIDDLKILKFGSLNMEFGENPSISMLKINKALGRFGDSSITYIKYKGNNYIIDTGFANEIDISDKNLTFNERSLKNIFNQYDLTFNDIDGIFITHWHTDHFGNLRLFSNAKIYSFLPDKEIYSEIFNNYDLSRDFSLNIDRIAEFYNFSHLLPVIFLNEKDEFAGCRIFPTPGHTLLHCSLLIEYLKVKIIVAGDAIVSQSYFDHDEIWQYNSGNLGKESCIKSMHKITSIADYIIPGHGHPFQNYKKRYININNKK